MAVFLIVAGDGDSGGFVVVAVDDDYAVDIVVYDAVVDNDVTFAAAAAAAVAVAAVRHAWLGS